MPGSYLVLELSNLCNLACVHCAVSEAEHPHHKSVGSFDINLANQLFEDMARSGIHFDTLIFFWLGEPLLHPHFCSIYQQALRFSVRYNIFSRIEVHTNAILMDINIIDALLNSASIPQRLHLSLDAATEETYKKIKGRDQFIAAVRHSAFFLRTKVGRGALWPRPVFQYILGSNNVHEAKAFLEHWTDVCTELQLQPQVVGGNVPPGQDPVIFFRQLDCPTREQQEKENALFLEFLQKEDIPHPPKAEAPILTKNLQPCSGFWKSPVLDWQGNLTFCTRDNSLKNSIGNIQETPFSQLWLSAQTQSIRNAVAAGNYSDLSLCSSCFIPRSLNHTEISSEEITTFSEYMRTR